MSETSGVASGVASGGDCASGSEAAALLPLPLPFLAVPFFTDSAARIFDFLMLLFVLTTFCRRSRTGSAAIRDTQLSAIEALRQRSLFA